MPSKDKKIRQPQSNIRLTRRQRQVEEKRHENETTDTKQKVVKKRRGRIRIRLIPIWLRLFIVITLMLLAMTAGLMVGYGVIGDGKATEVLQSSTWKKLVDLIEKNTENE